MRKSSELKTSLIELTINELEPIGKEIKVMLSNKDEIDKILTNGASRGRIIAKKVISDVKKIIGFIH